MFAPAMSNDCDGPRAPSAPKTYDTHNVPPAPTMIGGKRFRKIATRGPGALVSVRMERVETGRDGSDEQARDDAPVEDADELFEEALQQGRAGGGGRRRR
jgi:hypothetical protein